MERFTSTEENMDRPIEHFWQKRLQDLKVALEANNFEVFLVADKADAAELVLVKLLPDSGARSISWGGSMTFVDTGLYETLKNRTDMEVIDGIDKDASDEEKMDRRRRALLVDFYIAGSNAVTEEGQLVNLDMIGNRIGALTFGPKTVVVLVGRNKVVSDVEEAMYRIKNFVAPTNAMRLDMKTPCVKTSYCEECSSPRRICNTWTITEKSFPKGRVKIVLINEDLGL
jgi:L-lactate utilization protein LutB